MPQVPSLPASAPADASSPPPAVAASTVSAFGALSPLGTVMPGTPTHMPVTCACAVAPLPQWLSGAPGAGPPIVAHVAAAAVWGRTLYLHVTPASPIEAPLSEAALLLLLLHAAARTRRAPTASVLADARDPERVRTKTIEVMSILLKLSPVVPNAERSTQMEDRGNERRR